jgi:hypothetical protein
MEPEDGLALVAEPGHAMVGPLGEDAPAERCQGLLVDGAAAFVVAHVGTDMIEHADSLLCCGTTRRAYGEGSTPRGTPNRARKSCALCVSSLRSTFVDAHAVSPEMVMAAIVSVVPMKSGPPESP